MAKFVYKRREVSTEIIMLVLKWVTIYLFILFLYSSFVISTSTSELLDIAMIVLSLVLAVIIPMIYCEVAGIYEIEEK